jgi:predicted PurR-regulated permease PerM
LRRTFVGVLKRRVEVPEAVKWLALAMCLAAVLVLAPLWSPLVLGAWTGVMMRPLARRLAHRFGGRHRAAAALTIALLVLILTPFVIVGISLVEGANELVRKLHQSPDSLNALKSLVGDGNGGSGSLDPKSLVQQHKSEAWAFAQQAMGALAEVVIGLFVGLYGTYVFIVDGPRFGQWMELHAPITIPHLRRLGAAFMETGRGLLVGIGLTALIQGAFATIAYLVLGVPRPFVLGLLTALAGLIPTVGTSLVWVPVSAGLALSGRTGAAIAMAVIGVAVISTIDNVVRPVLARYGSLQLPTFVVLVSMFGGIALVGASGLILGPLLVRLAVEALSIAREARFTGAHLVDDGDRPRRSDIGLVERPSHPS